MIVKNEYIKIKTDKEITITNYIYDKYLEFVAKAQYDKSYMDFSMIECFLKFDTPFNNVCGKEPTDFDMAIRFSNRNLTASENTVEANYTFTPTEGNVYNPKTDEFYEDFTDIIGKKITAIGFNTMINYEEYIVACVDTSNYSTYFVENISFQRKDIFTSDTTVKDGAPINLTPFSNKNIVVSSARGDYIYQCYPVLYSIGLGTRRGEMEEEYIIKKNDIEQNFIINLGDIELCKIGNYQDKIYKQNDKWYLHKEIGKVVFNSATGLQNDLTNTLQAKLTDNPEYLKFTGATTENPCMYCDKFIFANNTQDNEHIYIASWQQVADGYLGNIRFFISHQRLEGYNSSMTNAQKLALVNNYLSSNPLICYLILSEATNTEITDTQLIQQLESIELYNGINNITTTGDLAGDLQIYYNYTTTGEVAKGQNLNIDVDITKDYWLGSLFGGTYQEENPTPTTPQNIKVVTGNQNIKVKSKASLEPNEVELIVESDTSFGFNLRKGLESNKYPSATTYAGSNLYPLPLKVSKEIQPHNKLYTGSGIVPLLADYKYIMYKYRYYYFDEFRYDYIYIDEYFITNLPNDTKGLFEIVTKIERSDV